MAKRKRQNKYFSYYPDEGPLRRELYAKHIRFFKEGAVHKERLFLAANRVGKTEGVGGFEVTAHATGIYPKWWQGRRFDRPITGWVAGKTNETTRDILQNKLFGQIEFTEGKKGVSGTGLIPGKAIGPITWKQGVQDLIDTIKIKHASGGWSRIGVKSYQQGRGSFEGTEQHVILLDEEPPLEIYTECLTRTMTTNGLIMITFTPLDGVSDVVLSFIPNGDVSAVL